ncbi:hypothetical protein JQX13_01555 [Archangium violaceum]|uniref:hypothetical protein n=1 Tax=Archangium violaceum TaxID=83451 RepID=UPI00193AFCFC|nr:hypothetical protein [Archangium violaceum]QRK08886.1 hypothetical protein JQX13_01555 [Archangium violaceum]
MTPGVAVARDFHPLLHPGNLDLRVEGGASLLPPSIEAGISTELGMVRLGAGTLSVGAEIGIHQCVLACSVRDLLDLRTVSNRDIHALGRVGYHFTLDDRNDDRMKLSGFLLAGVMEARTTQRSPDDHYEGRGRGLAFGLGVGGSYFLSPPFFVGGEARLRFASGSYDDGRHWVRGGLSTLLLAGIRLF